MRKILLGMLTILFIHLGLPFLIWPDAALAENPTIAVLLPLTSDAENSEFVERGILSALTTTALTAPSSYPHTYTVTVGSVSVDILITDDEASQTVMATQAADQNVIAIVTRTSSSSSAAGNLDPTDITIITTTATSSHLQSITNLLMMAPSNTRLSTAIYRVIGEDKISKFVIVYEPDIYGGDLFITLKNRFFNAFMQEFMRDTNGDIINDAENNPLAPSRLIGSFPMFDSISTLKDAQKGLHIIQVANVINDLAPDAIAYLGFDPGFKKAFEELSTAGLASVKWYTGDAVQKDSVLSITNIESSNLKVVTLGLGADRTQMIADYNTAYGVTPPESFLVDYAYDAGLFIKAVVNAVSGASATLNRSNFLTYAQTTDIDGITGKKGFEHMENEVGQFDVWTVNSSKLWEKTSQTLNLTGE